MDRGVAGNIALAGCRQVVVCLGVGKSRGGGWFGRGRCHGPQDSTGIEAWLAWRVLNVGAVIKLNLFLCFDHEEDQYCVKSMMSQSLFVYGSLMAPEVMQGLLGRLPPHCPAILSGYIRHPVRHQPYPGLIPCSQTGDNASSNTLGVLYNELYEQEMKRLDWFESSDYTRTPVMVKPLTKNGESAPAQPTQVYVFTKPVEELDTSREWSLEEFRAHHLQEFLTNSVRPNRIGTDDQQDS